LANFKASHLAEANSLDQTKDDFMAYADLPHNEIIEASSHLLGLVLRIQNLTTKVENCELLYNQVVTDIKTIERHLEKNGYEVASVIIWRYVICTFIDECIMSSASNLVEFWSNKSLLVHFHNEANGGEKVFHITERLISESERYKDILAFIYLCFSLGFRGRYRIYSQNNDEFEILLHKMHDILFAQHPQRHTTILHLGVGKLSAQNATQEITTKHLVLCAIIISAIAYFGYSYILNARTAVILEQLNNLLIN